MPGMLMPLAVADATAISVSDFQAVLTAIQGQISVATIVPVLTAGATASIGIVFMWFGVRKLTYMIMEAVKNGKIKE